jgi:hypothetical protein
MATSTHYPKRRRGRTFPPPAYPRRALTIITPELQPLHGLKGGGGEIRRFVVPPIREGGDAGAAPFSWSRNSASQPGPINGVRSMSRRFLIATRNLHVAGQYVRSYIFMGDRPQAKIYRYPNVLYTGHAGNSRSKPFVRNRIRSLGSRIPTVNTVNPDAIGPPSAYTGGYQ